MLGRATDQEVFDRLVDPSSGDDIGATYRVFLDRESPAVLRSGDVVVAAHEQVVSVLRDPGMLKPPTVWQPTRSLRTLFRMFLMANPPDHSRLRKVVAPFFTPARVRELTNAIECASIDLLKGRDVMDAVSEYAYPLPMRIVSGLLDIPAEDATAVASWARTLTATLDRPLPLRVDSTVPLFRSIANGTLRPREVLTAASRLVRYARNRVAASRTPLVDTLRTAVSDGTVSEDEAAATWILLVIAGHETTANLTSNCLHALATRPDQVARLRESPDLVAAAVEETLRYDAPVPMTARVPARDIDVFGTHARRGRWVFTLLGAANRDPRVFPDPDTFSVDRANVGDHVGFGHGIHFCLGAFLARLETQTAVRTLLANSRRLALAAPAHRRTTFAVRGFDRLPLALA